MYDGEQSTKIGVPFDTTRFSERKDKKWALFG